MSSDFDEALFFQWQGFTNIKATLTKYYPLCIKNTGKWPPISVFNIVYVYVCVTGRGIWKATHQNDSVSYHCRKEEGIGLELGYQRRFQPY